ncbi:MAG TPA: FixH family protein [Labilithrix sp.]|nr:FixH family protein [Labilithrix sp.]
MKAKRSVYALAFALPFLAACSGAGSDDDVLTTLRGDSTVRVSSSQRIEVDLRPAEPIKLGKNSVIVRFPANTDAEVATVSALMPAHGHGAPAPTIEREDDGGYVVRDLVLYMSGRWELRLGLRVDERPDEVLVAVDVP